MAASTTPDLQADEGGGELALTTAARPAENDGACFTGGVEKGRFDVDAALAKVWRSLPNPNGRSNADVVLPWVNGLDVTRRPPDTWIADFGLDRSVGQARRYEEPFSHVMKLVKPARDVVGNPLERARWWLHARPAPDLRAAIDALPRFIATARVAKHRLYVWLSAPVVVDGQLVITARADDTTFGVLHSRLHELWSLRLCTWMGKGNDPRYTPTSTFETFPFPAGLTPADTVHQRTETLPDGAVIPADLPAAKARTASCFTPSSP